MAKLDLNRQQGDETKHGGTSIELLGMTVEAKPRQTTLGNVSGLKHRWFSDGMTGGGDQSSESRPSS